ncbi:MAG TPA: molybdenum cofactor guanylyltransferase [Candidatus Aerophobetes bacterium]|uniref:Probable molybdenum cofactor guanylyltransferase n=1 Tax=Aerophobetes bacterium TaxID=2030807 RepID=A0A7V5LZP7_UNCAE|nr:molybdenum cofactor guanylyltransferase [Candidatus Aerophobetes bacterium]
MNFLILVGGENRRIGNCKAFLKIGRKNLLEKVLCEIDKAKEKREEVVLVGGKFSEKKDKMELFRGRKLKVIEDVYPGKGPLGGIYSGLLFSESEFNFVVGCDMPFLNWKFISYMRYLPRDYDILLPSHQKGVEPLHAIYSKSCLPIIERKLKEGKLNIRSIFPYLKIRFVGEEEIKNFSSPDLLFFNVNTLDDLKRAEKLEKRNLFL